MIRSVTMRIIDGIRYRPEDAPETIDPAPILQPEPEEVAGAEPQEDAEADLAKVAPSVAAAAKRKPKASKAK
ncbi:hypothetical protein [Bifidobacterium cuniculi]|nr:hypothetical protein [Bifidobacterium cuniculi]